MQNIYDEFIKRDTVVIAISQEDTDLKTHGNMVTKIKPSPRFDIVADLNRKKTKRYDRTTTYFIDKQGIVRQIFPMLIHTRASWSAILNEIDRINATSEVKP